MPLPCKQTALLILLNVFCSDYVMTHISVSSRLQAEARLAAKRAARAEARDIRMKELERQQKEVSSTSATTDT